MFDGSGVRPQPVQLLHLRDGKILRPTMDERMQRRLRIAAILFFRSLVVFATFHEPTRFAHTLQKLAHPVTFGAIALLVLSLVRHETPRRFRSYVVAFALTVLCG